MNWGQLYRARSYVRSALWIVPIFAIVLTMAATRVVHWLDTLVDWKLLGFGVTGAQAALQSIETATLSFLVFTFGSLLVAIQVASGQLTPRIIATTLLGDNVVRYTVGLFIFMLLLAIGVHDRIEGKVHQLPLFVAVLCGLLSFAAFLYLIDYASRLLRPITILISVANRGLAVIDSVYPDPSLGPNIPERQRERLGPPTRVIPHEGTSGVILAVDIPRLLVEAERSDVVIELVPLVGDFVALEEPLFRLYGGARSAGDTILRSAIAVGSERTIEQDPTFAFRVVVDIALKAVSPAINDPTTAVLAIDQLHRLLRSVGKRHLRTDEILDKPGQLRVIVRTPYWEDFVDLAFSEIRACGANNLQIVRRLRAMIENLNQTLPGHRQPALQQQLSLLDREIDRQFRYPEELALARRPDSQGLGGRPAP